MNTPVLLTRPGCHLCDDFLAQWRQAFPGVDLPKRNIDNDAGLHVDYGARIPVLLDDCGEAVCEAFFAEAACVPVARTLGWDPADARTDATAPRRSRVV